MAVYVFTLKWILVCLFLCYLVVVFQKLVQDEATCCFSILAAFCDGFTHLSCPQTRTGTITIGLRD